MQRNLISSSVRHFHNNSIVTRWTCGLIIFLLQAMRPVVAQNIINASDFGVKPNSFENAAPAIKRAIAASKANPGSILLLPGGRIDVWPEGSVDRELYISNCTENDTLPKVKHIAFAFDDCRNITLDGSNSLVVLHGKMVSFAVLNSSNIVVKNIQFDYERPTMSELTIGSVTDTAIEATIHPDSKYTIDKGRIIFYGEGWKVNSYHTILFDPNTETLHYSDFKPFLQARAFETSPFNVTFKGNFQKTNFHRGNVLTIRDPYRDNCGAFINLSKNITLENVKMHFMHGLGIVSQFSENISLLKVVVAPRENSGRVIASFADCFHFSGCKGLIRIDSCFTSGSHDDPINVHGTHLEITKVDKNGKMIVRFMHPQTYGFAAFFPGDSIAFVNPKTLIPTGTAKLISAKLVSKREMKLEVDRTLSSLAKEGLCIENLNWTPEVTIQNSYFERTNTRGILVTTRKKVVIENNIFNHTGMYPILIADDALSWFESGAVKDVTIRNNTFDGCGYNSGSGAISIAPENHELVLNKFVHRNIRVIDNRFKIISPEVLAARSTDHLVFTGNEIIPDSSFKNNSSKSAIELTACKNVLVEKNQFELPELPALSILAMKEEDVKTDMKLNKK